jgi:hypothetical protein
LSLPHHSISSAVRHPAEYLDYFICTFDAAILDEDPPIEQSFVDFHHTFIANQTAIGYSFLQDNLAYHSPNDPF